MPFGFAGLELVSLSHTHTHTERERPSYNTRSYNVLSVYIMLVQSYTSVPAKH